MCCGGLCEADGEYLSGKDEGRVGRGVSLL